MTSCTWHCVTMASCMRYSFPTACWPSQVHPCAQISVPATPFLIWFISCMLNLAHICYYDLYSHMSSRCLPHVSHPTYSHACTFPPSYFPHFACPLCFPHIFKTCKSCMFLQFIYRLLLLMFDLLSLTPFDIFQPLETTQLSNLGLLTSCEPGSYFHSTLQLYDFPMVHWKHIIPAYIQNTWTVTEGWCSAPEAPVQNPLISRPDLHVR